MDASRNVGSGSVPSPSPSEVTTNIATAHVTREYAIPVADGLASGAKMGLLSSKVGRVVLTVICLSPLLVTAYHRMVPYAPMRSEEGTWSSGGIWQWDIPSRISTKRRGDTLVFYASDWTTDHCGKLVGSTPGLSGGKGWVWPPGRALKMVAWRDRGLMAISYDQDDPWVFFTRGSPPKRTVTVRYHQIDTKTCTD